MGLDCEGCFSEVVIPKAGARAVGRAEGLRFSCEEEEEEGKDASHGRIPGLGASDKG